MSTKNQSRAWVEVRGDSLRENLRTIQRAAGPGARLIPMVKADAYGLGVGEAVRAIDPLDPWGYGVATVAEGEELRGLGVSRPVVVFSPAAPGEEPRAVEADLTLAISDLSGLERLASAARGRDRTAAFHVEADTGMGRSGFLWSEVARWLPDVEAASDGLRWEGCFTHFHSADAADPTPTRGQWERFGAVVEALGERADRLILHACNSPASLRGGAFALGAVRPGIFPYGGEAGEGLPAPAEVASVRARVLLVKDVPRGATVGYGATHVASRAERWATLGIGYGDGLPRLLSNRGRVLIRGRSCPIVGRISMDVTVVDISGVPAVKPGDVATVIGTDRGERITLEEVAALAGTINYEVLTGLTPRLPRVWSDGAPGAKFPAAAGTTWRQEGA